MPALHAVHAVAPVLAWYVPAPQTEHELAPLVEYAPVAQFAQIDAAVAPVTVEYVPALHVVHAAPPMLTR